MNKITAMDKPSIKRLNEAAAAALAKVAEEHGVTVKVGGGRYDPTAGTFVPKIEFALPDSDRREWERSCALIGLAPEDFGKEFVASGKTFTTKTINLRAPKRPVHCTDASGKTYVFPEAIVKAGLAAAKANR